jgi:acid phosphatase
MRSIAAVLVAAGLASAATTNVSEPSLTEIEQAAATTKPYSPVSDVKGLAFDRIVDIWLENVVSSRFACHCNLDFH